MSEIIEGLPKSRRFLKNIFKGHSNNSGYF